MAFSKTLMAALLLSSLLVSHLVEAQQMVSDIHGSTSPSPQASIDCGAACQGRCKLSKRPNLCGRACGSCCARCNCVPPGTAGNYEYCPCYGNLTTRNQVRKCP